MSQPDFIFSDLPNSLFPQTQQVCVTVFHGGQSREEAAGKLVTAEPQTDQVGKMGQLCWDRPRSSWLSLSRGFFSEPRSPSSTGKLPVNWLRCRYSRSRLDS